MPNIRWLLALITRAQRALYLATGGVIGARFFGIRMLLLSHTGRKSGASRLTPLLYVEDGADVVIVASNAGDALNPAWLYNLRANPDVEVQLGREHRAVRAREAGPEEAARLWPLLTASYRFFPDYQRRADRPIPILILEPRPN